MAKAKGFYETCETLPIYIGKDELIIGHAGGKSRAAIISPDVSWKWLAAEVDTVNTRAVNPYELSEEDKTILKEEFFPYWEGRALDESVYRELEELGLLSVAFESGIIDCEVKTTSGGADFAPGFGNILLKKGFGGIKKHAKSRIESLNLEKAEELEQFNFLKSIMIICDGMELLIKRYADLAREKADKAEEPGRKSELLTMVSVCDHISTNPPRNFYEALQLTWFGQVSVYIEETNAGTSPGRADQYLYPFFQEDIKKGILEIEHAKEIFYAFMIKFNENVWPLSEFGSQFFAGYIPFQNMSVGGLKRDGTDATNELSYLIMDCTKNLRMYHPSLTARVHKNSPKEFLQSIADLVSIGLGFPSINYDEASIDMLMSRGVPLEEARDYCVSGCTEPFLQGKLFRWSLVCRTGFPIAVEFALNNGTHLKTGKKLGIETGDLEKFDTFKKFEFAVKEQMNYLYKICSIITTVVEKAHKRLLPKPVSSMLVEGCIENGRELIDRGSTYHWGPGIVVVGIADYANSLAAIKKLVYDDKLITLNQLSEVLKNNFEGYEEIQSLCNNAPKYGNDNDYVDKFATDMIDFSGQVISNHKGLIDNMELLTLGVSSSIPMGEAVGALPYGRKAWTPISEGISPTPGTDVSGPTAMIKSVVKINSVMSSGGTLLNMKVDPKLLSTEKDKENFIALIKAHNILGGSHIQFNCVSSETLLDAQEHPEKYRSLIIRVAGYSAYFTEIPKPLQDEIIRRTTHLSFS